MVYTETKGKLFSTNDYYVYCINAKLEYVDILSKQIDNKFKIKNIIEKKYLNNVKVGHAILYGKLFSLIIKDEYKDTPRYTNLNKALIEMKQLCIKFDIKKIIIPKLGEKFYDLDYINVKDNIIKVFNDLDIEIIMMEV